MGKKFLIETDHKPLVPLLNTKHLDSLPPRVLRFRLRLARFNYIVKHLAGKLIYTADVLSRAPTATAQGNQALTQEAELWIDTIVQSLPASQQRLQEYPIAQAEDPVCSELINFCRNGWPTKNKFNPILKPYWETQHKLSLSHNLLLCGSCTVVPSSIQKQKLENSTMAIRAYKDASFRHKAPYGGQDCPHKLRRGFNNVPLVLNCLLSTMSP